MPFMRGMEELQARQYDKIHDGRKWERKNITDRIYAEELASAKQEQANGTVSDPCAAGEWVTKQRLEPQRREESMDSSGMGGMPRMQQEAWESTDIPQRGHGDVPAP